MTDADRAMLERWASLPLSAHLDAREEGLAAALRACLFEVRRLRAMLADARSALR